MIAKKREVAAYPKGEAGFPWSECQVIKLATSHCTDFSATEQINRARFLRIFL